MASEKGNLPMLVAAAVVFVFYFRVVEAQTYKVVYKEIPDNRGKEFIVGFLRQFNHELDGATRLFITSDYNTRVVITARHTNVRKEIQVKSRQLYPIDLPTSIRMSGKKIENKGIHIFAESEIVVYGLNIKKFTTDAYLALPVDIQSKKYLVTSFKPSYKSLIGIIGIHDRTVVFVTFKFAGKKSYFTYKGAKYRSGQTLSITLNRLQTFQVAHTKDMTGTAIYSTRPISVFSGNECANVPSDKGYCDHLVEHIPPVNTWGQRFITAPLAGRSGGDFFRILAANESTSVSINGKHVRTLKEGKFVQVDVPSNRYQYIETSKPCLVMQFSKGRRVDNTQTDPFMLMIPPVEQYTAQYTISTPDQNEKYFTSYLNIIISTKEIDGLRLDGRTLRNEKWVPIWGTTHSAARIQVSFGVHRVIHDSPIVPFAVFSYGYARADSYGYPGGLRLADLTLECVPGNPGDGLDNDCDRRIDEEIKNFIDDDGDGRIDEDLVTEPPKIVLDVKAIIANGCPEEVKKQLKEPTVISAPLCTSRGRNKLTYVDTMYERECVQYIDRLWLVRDGCGNLANVTQQIRIRRPEMSVVFPKDVRGKCSVGEDLSVVGQPLVTMSCKKDRFVTKHRDSPSLTECVRRGQVVGREWTVKASCGSSVKHVQKFLPDVTPPKVNFIGKLQFLVKSNFRISWNASEQSTFTCALNNLKNTFLCGEGWGETWSRRDIPDGKHVFYVRPTDLAGNTGATISHPFQVDNRGPRLTFDKPLKTLSNGPMAIKWMSNELARFKCGLNPERLEQCGSGTRGREYRRDLRDGTYSLYVGAVDQIGNEAEMIKHTFRIDSTPPRIKFGSSSRLDSNVDLPLLSNEWARFLCSIDGSEYSDCGSGLNGRFTARDLVEGPHQVKVKAIDKAGNEADPISLKWNSDKTSPNIIFTPGLPTKFREMPKITWKSTEYASFECSLDNNSVFKSCGEGVKGTWTQSKSRGGFHDFFVRGTDRNGNVGPTANFRFTIDKKYPIVYLNRPLPRTSGSDTITFRWTSNEMAYYKCALDDVSRLQDCGSGLLADWTTPTLTNGQHTFYLVATDEVGNEAPMLSHTWTTDKVAPVLEFTDNLPNNSNVNAQKIRWTSSETAKFKCFVDSETNSIPCGSGRRGSWTSPELSDGVHTFKVFGTDENGNVGETIQHTWEIDTRAPDVDFATVPDAINNSKALFKWKTDEPATYICALDDDEDGNECGEGIDGEYLTPTLADGEHEFRLLVEDMVGNLAPLIRSKFSIDTTNPVITFDKPDPEKPQKDLSVSWKSSEEADFECSLDDPTLYEPCGNGKTGLFQKDDLPDGEHRFYVRGKDNVGNVGDPSVYTVVTDRSPPSAQFTDKIKPISNNTRERITWSSNEPATFKCKIDERPEVDCGNRLIGEFLTPDLPDGDHVFKLTPVDEAGNKGRTIERKWTKDTSPPSVIYTSQPQNNSTNSVHFKWKSSEYAEFDCLLDDASTIIPCGNGTVGEKNLTDLDHGPRIFRVRGKDSAGNVGEFVPHRWLVDTNPPVIEFTGDLPSYSKTSLVLTWKTNEDSMFECALDDLNEFEDCGNGWFGQRRLTSLTEGPHTFYVRARDYLGNIVAPISHSWIVDSIPPRAVLEAVSPVVGTPYVTLSWTADERSKFLCAIGDVGNVIECGQGTSGSWTTPYLREGPHKFWLIASDDLGNQAEPVSVKWTVDNKAPVITFSKDSKDKSVTSSPRVSWTSDEQADTFECSIKGLTSFEQCGSGLKGSWTGTNVPDGKHTFLVRARDAYDNQNEPYSFPFEVDTTPPTGFVVTGPPRRTNKPEATFSWRTSEDADFECYLNNQVNSTKCGEGTNGFVTTQPLEDGKHNFSVVATDDLGNKAHVVNASWTVDTTGPNINFDSNLPKHTLANPSFTWTSDETGTFLCALDGETNWESCGTGKTGSWQGYNVPDGSHRFYVKGTDDLGNSGPSIVHNFDVDNTAPRVRLTRTPEVSSNQPNIEWKSTEPVNFKCSLDDGLMFDCGENSTVGSWTGRNLPDGPRKFVIVGEDKLGNTGTFIYSWRKDTTLPVVRFDANQPKVTRRYPRFTWTSSEDAVFECSLDDFQTSQNCGSGKSGSWQKQQVDGVYEFSVRATDINGNTGEPTKHVFRVDNSAPTVVIQATNDLSTSEPEIRWTSNENVTFKCSFDDGRFFNCGSGKTGSWTGRNVRDGPHKFIIEGKDEMLNTGRHTFTWNKDSSGPEIQMDADLPSVTLSFPRITWKSSEPASFECSFDGFVRDIKQCGYGNNGRWQSYKPDGQYTFYVRGRDRNGNTGSIGRHSFKVDNTAPKVTIVTKPEINSSSPNISWSSSESVKYTCSLDYALFADCGQGLTGSWTGNNIPDGQHTFVVRGRDEMGNTGTYTYRWSQDSVAPVINFQQTPDPADPSPRFTWTSSEPAYFQCSLDGGKYVDCGRGYNGQWRRRVPGGKHSFSVRGKDAHGSTGEPATHTWTIDTSGPVVTINNLRLTSSGAELSWSSNKPARRFECSLDNDYSWQYCGSGNRGNKVYYSLSHGKHTFYVRGWDIRGNVGDSDSREFSFDRTPPNVVITSKETQYSTKNPLFTWKSSETATFKCAIDDTRLYQDCGSGLTGQHIAKNVRDGRHAFFMQGTDEFGNIGPHVQHIFTVDTVGPQVSFTTNVQPTTSSPRVRITWISSEVANFTCTVDGESVNCGSGTRGEFTTKMLPDGTHTFSLDVVDKVGNRGQSISTSWKTDSQSPEIYFDPTLPRKTSSNPTIAWTSSEFSAFECDLDGKQKIRCGQGTSMDMTFGVASGPHYFSVRGTDNHGNVGEWKRFDFEVDADGPLINFPDDQSQLTNAAPTFKWTSSEKAVFKCGIDNSFNLQDCGEGLTGSWTGKNIPDGSHVFIVVGTDELGNQGQYAQIRFTVDNTVPEITFPETFVKTNSNPEISWRSSENAQFECSLDGGDFEGCGSGLSNRWSRDNLPDGKHTFSVRGRDRNGNVGEVQTIEWTVDSQAPTLSITSNTPTSNNNLRQTISWNTTEPANFECKLNGFVVSCGELGTEGSYTTPNLEDKVHTFEVTAIDDVENRGKPTFVTWRTDTTSPVLSLTSRSPSRTNQPSQTIRWSSNEPSVFECMLNGRKVECGNGTFGVYTTPNLPNGPQTFTVNAVDKVGNKGSPKFISWFLDNEPPVITLTDDVSSSTNNPRVLITWNSTEPANFECTLNGEQVDCGRGTSGIYTTPVLPDGNHKFVLVGVDDLGNRGTPMVVDWLTDKKGPGLSITSSNPAKTNNKQQTFRWTSTEPATFKCTLNGRAVDCGQGTNGQFTTPTLPDGQHTFQVNAVDNLGNKGTPQTVRWTTDSRAPVLTFTNDVPSKSNDPEVSISWNSDEPADFECTHNGLSVDCGSGTRGVFSTRNLPDGNNVFTVNGVDDLGNKGVPKVISWLKDTTGPGLTITSSNPPKTSNKRQTLTWSSTERATFECTLDGKVVECGSGTTGRYTTPSLPDGDHEFKVTPVDDLDNRGIEKTVKWSTDTTGPRTQFTNTVPSSTNQTIAKLSWRSNEAAIFTCSLDGVEVPCGDDTNGTVGSYTTPDLGDGRHFFSVLAEDPLGNIGRPVTFSWDIDSTAPDVAFSSSLTKKTRGNPYITWSSSEISQFECTLDLETTSKKTKCGRGRSGQWNGFNISHGPHTFWVRGTDNQGNVGEWKPFSFEVDSDGPEITFNDHPKKFRSNPTLTWSSSEPANFKCRMENSLEGFDCGNGMTGQFTGNRIPDGPHKLFVYGVDEMNNIGDVKELQFHIDSTGPKITFSADQPTVTKNFATFNWTSSESARFKCALDDGNLEFVDCGEGTSGTWFKDNLPDGPWRFVVYGTDDMNNRGSEVEHNFVVDNTGPEIVFVNPPRLTNNVPTFAWTSQEDAEFMCSLDGADYEKCGSGRTGIWTRNNLPHGRHTFSVRGKDKNGNIGIPVPHVFNVDTRPPNVVLASTTPKTSNFSTTFKWTSDEEATFLCAIDNSLPEECGSGVDGEWTTPRLNDGNHVFFLIATDLVGNRAPKKAMRWTIDSVGPKISFLSNQPTSTRSSPTIRWTSSENARFKCAIDNGQRQFVDCGEGFSGEWTGTNLPDGVTRFLVYGVDKTNNQGPTSEHQFTVDTRPPQVTFLGELPKTREQNPTIRWSSNEYASFECMLQDNVVFDCGAGGEGSWTGRNLVDGPHILYVRGTDRLNNKGEFISTSWKVDESGPRLQFLGKIPSRTRRFPRLRWRSNEYAFFECSLNGGEYRSCGNGMLGSWTKDESPTGKQVFMVRGRDVNKNYGDPIAVTFIVDTTAPTITLLEPLPTTTKSPTWTFTWTSSELANFSCAVNTLANPVDCGFGLNGRFTTQPLTDGLHSFYLLGEDAIGNTARVITHRWVVDKTKPEIVILPNQPGVSDKDITILWKTVSNKPAKFECALDDMSQMEPCGEGTTGSWSGIQIPDGNHSLYVRGKDGFGDYGQVQIHSWKVDTKVPQIRLVGKPPLRSTYSVGSFSWTSDEFATFSCAVDVAEYAVPCGNGFRGNWMSSELDDGAHSFYLFAEDANGNQADPITYQWIIDTTPPVVTLDENSERVSGRSVTIKWRANENAIFRCSVDNVFDDRDCGSGLASQIKLTDLEDGEHSVWIKATDTLGNLAPWKKHTWVVDSKPPELDFTSNLPNKTSGDVKFFWRSKEEASFECGTDADNLTDCGVGDVGNWSAKNLSDGDHVFFVEAIDEFGNKVRIQHQWTVDDRPPILSWRRRVPAVTTKRVRFRWRSNEIADFYCAHENYHDMKPCGSLKTKGNRIIDNLPEGKHLFWVLGVDEVGNRGLPLSHEWIVDTKGPTLFFNQPMPRKSGRSVRFSWRSNERARFQCAFDNINTFFDCGEGFESDLQSNNLRRNGLHSLYVRGTDDYGNVGEMIRAEWTVDLVAPVIVDVGPLPRLSNPNPIITWTVNEEAVFECALDNNNYIGCGNGTDGTWRGHNLPKGDHRIIVRAKDPQGNLNKLIDHKFAVGIPDNRGREFMLAFMQQFREQRQGSVSLFITAENDTTATISTLSGFKRRIELEADELKRVELPIEIRLSGTQKERKGISVIGEQELVVYGLNIMPHSTDAFLALPTDIQATEYYAVSYTVSQNSLIGVVGIYDGTIVYITLKMTRNVPLTYQGAIYRDGETLIVEINRQETFQLAHSEDLTGSRIASTRVISVFSGSECANVPKKFGYCDHLVEMLTPTSTWGRRFVTAPLFSRKAGDFFRVVASKDNTMVTFHPRDVQYLNAGEFMERDIPSDEYKFITASHPCMLLQYSKGADADSTNTDPFLLMIPPIEQYASNYILSTPDRARQQYFQSYINVIVLTKHYRGVIVDGRPAYLANSFKQITGTPYSASAVKVTKGVHRVDHTSPIVTFGAFMYGYAWRDSYGYPGGLRLADITGACTSVDTPADGMDNDCDRRIDEELKNGIDDDGDGRIDEDLATFPPTIELESLVHEYESCTFVVDALVPRPKVVSSAECDSKGALRVSHFDKVSERDCIHSINRTWEASDGCGNVVYLSQIIEITRPRLTVRFPTHVPNGCAGSIALSETGRPQVEGPCDRERVRVAYRDNISKKECQENGLLLERHFTIDEVCGRQYKGVQRIYPGARN